MTGAGNDIVALKVINIARTKQPDFYSKILSPPEVELYDKKLQDELPFENFVWLAWSVKESAYKFLKRFTPDLVFSPSKIVVRQLIPPGSHTKTQMLTERCGFENMPAFKGVAEFKNETLYSRSVVNKDFIFSAVDRTEDLTNTWWGIKKTESSDHADQSGAVRAFLIGKLNDLFPNADLKTGKSPYGWPVVLNRETELPMPVSFTHHDHFVAYSFQLY